MKIVNTIFKLFLCYTMECTQYYTDLNKDNKSIDY